MNELASHSPSQAEQAPASVSSGQSVALETIRAAYLDVGGNAECTTPAAALQVLCGSAAGYEAQPSAATPLRWDSQVSLPNLGSQFADAPLLLKGSDLTAWRD